MDTQSRRGLLKGAAKAVVAATGGAMAVGQTGAQAVEQMGQMTKRDATVKAGSPPPATPLPFTTVVGIGNFLFVAGIGCRVAGTIEENTKWVLDEMERNLVAAGSSLEKVVKVNVSLLDMKDFDRMNAVYKTRKWGSIFPARNTVQVAGLPAGDYGLAIECIAYV